MQSSCPFSHSAENRSMLVLLTAQSKSSRISAFNNNKNLQANADASRHRQATHVRYLCFTCRQQEVTINTSLEACGCEGLGTYTHPRIRHNTYASQRTSPSDQLQDRGREADGWSCFLPDGNKVANPRDGRWLTVLSGRTI